MTQTIAVINEKGGVAKTTTAVNLAAGLTRSGHRVLLIDLDPQANTTTYCGLDWNDYTGCSVGDALLLDEPDLAPFILIDDATQQGLIPATPELREIAEELVVQGKPIQRLAQALKPLADQYDYTLLDLPPNIQVLHELAIEAADRFIIPLELSAFSLVGLNRLINNIQRHKGRRPDWQFRILLSRLSGFNKRANQEAEQVLGSLAEYVLTTSIRFNGKIAESQFAGSDIFAFDPRCRGARDFRKLTDEVIALWPVQTLQTN
jgi:chromosome partitioning protein